ncbi:hypothetical protein GUY40_15420 [Pseudomonas sp. R5(2019)]|nr:hypothetical protein [Pseudomonas sp. R5(2019)]
MLALGACWLTAAAAAPMRWADIRDGSLYLQASRADSLNISWAPAWQAEANTEHLYLLDGQGRLQAERTIAPAQTSGSQHWPLAASAASYRLEIPGYSFRRYRVEHNDSTGAQFEPVKVHFSVETRDGIELYFRVGPNEQAILAGKFHGGVRALQAERLGDKRSLALALKPYPAYWQFDQVSLPVSATEQTWRLRLIGDGKAAFWLDGTANLFAQQPQQLKPLNQESGRTQLNLGSKPLGPTPALGINLPYVVPPTSSYAMLDALRPQAAGYYTLADILARDRHYEDGFRNLYQTRFGITQDITLMAATGRRADLTADAQSEAGLQAWLAATQALGGKGLHYIAFADEPNLNYGDYGAYKRFFDAMAARVKATPGAHAAGVRIAMPASSRLINGPFHSNAGDRRGLDWARRLLNESGERIDALAWHEWMIRDLLATRTYRDSVRQAAELVGLDDQGRPRKALLLDQTNLSSGSNLSLYEQDSHFTALWWASVVINAASDGLLSMLNWFHAADEPEWPKGMIRVLDENHFELKPVGLAQQFIQRHWLGTVLALDNDAFEVDALAMAGQQRRSLLGVNKGPRLQQISLQAQDSLCPLQGAELVFFGADNQSRPAPFECQQGQVRFQVPGQTLFALTWRSS